MKKTTTVLSLLSIITLAMMPVAALAVGKDINYLVGIVNRSFTTAIYLIISFSILTFVYNVYNYFIKADADRKEAGMYVLMSVIGFFVILSFWGLVNIVKSSLDLDTGAPAGLFGGNGASAGGGGGQSGTGFAPGGGLFGNSSTGPASGGGSSDNSVTGGASGSGSFGNSTTGPASGGGPNGNSSTGAASGGGASSAGTNPYTSEVATIQQEISDLHCDSSPEDAQRCSELKSEKFRAIGNAEQWDRDSRSSTGFIPGGY